ncbi:PKD domain-containing protein [bacterium]|nr:PKD domain-containing protein [bacterium]NCQ55893.1 PKD domain-containing protein [Candidatus Parcubacteria bacterium]NCS67601.1 PKD domain-containing protein [Candidatus Peregrinibacteria bacterium]NCS96234.1 PKD domain-containing protein [bacterium]
MKKLSLSAVALGALSLFSIANAAGGYTAWYQSQFGGGSNYNQPINNGYVGSSGYTNNYNYNSNYNQNYAQNPSSVGIGGYNTFSGNNGYGNSTGGGLTAYYAANGTYSNNNYNSYNNSYNNNGGYNNTYGNTGGGYTEYFGRNLQANTFATQCNPAPRPNPSTCQGGRFEPITNTYGCTIDWQCQGGSFCPVVNRPPDSQCNGVWEAQYNAGTQCLTHFFCDRTQDDSAYCPAIYDPVCGSLGGDRLVTYSSRCHLGLAGARFLYEGQCSETPNPGGRPVITGFDGPSSLNVNQTGTWTVQARGGYNSQLSYSIDWGENLYGVRQMSQIRPSQTTTFTHQYSQAGTYTVRVTVSDQNGQQAVSTKTVRVQNGNYGAPTISSFTGPSTLEVGETGNFKVVATDPTDRPVEFSINWGDLVYAQNNDVNDYRGWGSSRSFQHVYNLPGTYQVRVTATSVGGSTTKVLTVKVTERRYNNAVPVVHGISGPTTLTTGQTGTWRVQASDPNNQDLMYQIDYGDRNYASQSRSMMAPESGFVQNSTFTHQYNQAGTYTVSITVKNRAGKTARTTTTVRVSDGYVYRPYEIPTPMYNY